MFRRLLCKLGWHSWRYYVSEDGWVMECCRDCPKTRVREECFGH